MLCKPSVFRPHSSSDPLTRATFPPRGKGLVVIDGESTYFT